MSLLPTRKWFLQKQSFLCLSPYFCSGGLYSGPLYCLSWGSLHCIQTDKFHWVWISRYEKFGLFLKKWKSRKCSFPSAWESGKSPLLVPMSHFRKIVEIFLYQLFNHLASQILPFSIFKGSFYTLWCVSGDHRSTESPKLPLLLLSPPLHFFLFPSFSFCI